MLVLTIILYCVLAFLFWYAGKGESLDIFCPMGTTVFSKPVCGDGKGKFYCEGRGKETDRVAHLLDKLEHLSETDSKNVLWRRSYMLAVLMAFLISVMVLGHAPNGSELLILIFVPFTVTYFGLTFYKQHYNKFVSEFSRENIDLIRKKLNAPRNTKVVI